MVLKYSLLISGASSLPLLGLRKTLFGEGTDAQEGGAQKIGNVPEKVVDAELPHECRVSSPTLSNAGVFLMQRGNSDGSVVRSRSKAELKRESELENAVLRAFKLNSVSFAQKAIHLDGVYGGSLFTEGDKVFSMVQIAKSAPREHNVALVQIYPKVEVIKPKLPEPFQEISYIGTFNNLRAFLTTSPAEKQQTVVYFDDDWNISRRFHLSKACGFDDEEVNWASVGTTINDGISQLAKTNTKNIEST